MQEQSPFKIMSCNKGRKAILTKLVNRDPFQYLVSNAMSNFHVSGKAPEPAPHGPASSFSMRYETFIHKHEVYSFLQVLLTEQKTTDKCIFTRIWPYLPSEQLLSPNAPLFPPNTASLQPLRSQGMGPEHASEPLQKPSLLQIVK